MKPQDITIRREDECDYRAVEEVTREAFWNLYVPGCNEHLLANKLRKCPDFIPELDFVVEKSGKIVGNIMFTRCFVVDALGTRHELIMFGPVCVLPQLHEQGIGSALIRHALNAAKNIGYKAVAIYGYPNYYQKFGFRNGKEFGISNLEGRFPLALQLLELSEGALAGITGRLHESPIYVEFDENNLESFDATFPPKDKLVVPSQKLFEETSSMYIE